MQDAAVQQQFFDQRSVWRLSDNLLADQPPNATL